MHEDVKRFYLDGEVKYEYLAKTRKSLEAALEDQMRMFGYVPILDIDPQLTQAYNPDKELFKVTITLYGGYIGEDECKYSGLMYGKPIMKYIPTPRSNESSTT